MPNGCNVILPNTPNPIHNSPALCATFDMGFLLLHDVELHFGIADTVPYPIRYRQTPQILECRQSKNHQKETDLNTTPMPRAIIQVFSSIFLAWFMFF